MNPFDHPCRCRRSAQFNTRVFLSASDGLLPLAASTSALSMYSPSAIAAGDDTTAYPPIHRLIPSLPDEISLQIIARLPLSSHTYLSLVSRSWRAFFRFNSSLLFSIRSHLHISHHFPILSIRTPYSTSVNSSCYFLFHLDSPNLVSPLPSPPVPTIGSASVTIGPFFFLLGGSYNGLPTSKVQIFDCRVRRWWLGPRMDAARQFAATGVVKGRIYVLGGCSSLSNSWAEVLDWGDGCGCKKWKTVLSPVGVREKWMHGNAVLDGKILALADRGGVVFNPVMETWGSVPTVLDFGWKGRAAVVNGIVYSYDYLGKIKGYDQKSDKWIEVEGLEKDLPVFLAGAMLADVGGRLFLVWEGKGKGRKKDSSKKMEFIFAEIHLMVENNGGLSGSVGWSKTVVLQVPKGSAITHCVAVQL